MYMSVFKWSDQKIGMYIVTPKEIVMSLLYEYYLHVDTILIEIFVKKPVFLLVTLIDFTFGAGEKHPVSNSLKVVLIVCRARIAQSV